MCVCVRGGFSVRVCVSVGGNSKYCRELHHGVQYRGRRDTDTRPSTPDSRPTFNPHPHPPPSLLHHTHTRERAVRTCVCVRRDPSTASSTHAGRRRRWRTRRWTVMASHGVHTGFQRTCLPVYRPRPEAGEPREHTVVAKRDLSIETANLVRLQKVRTAGCRHAMHWIGYEQK